MAASASASASTSALITEKEKDKKGCVYQDNIPSTGEQVTRLGFKCTKLPKGTFLYRGNDCEYYGDGLDKRRTFSYFSFGKYKQQFYGQTIQYKTTKDIYVLRYDEPDNLSILDELRKYVQGLIKYKKNKKGLTPPLFHKMKMKELSPEDLEQLKRDIFQAKIQIKTKIENAKDGKTGKSFVEDLKIVKLVCLLNYYFGERLISGYATEQLHLDLDVSKDVTFHSEILLCMPWEYIEIETKCEETSAKSSGYGLDSKDVFLKMYRDSFTTTNLDEGLKNMKELTKENINMSNVNEYIDVSYLDVVRTSDEIKNINDIYDIVIKNLTPLGETYIEKPGFLYHLLLISEAGDYSSESVEVLDNFYNKEITKDCFIKVMKKLYNIRVFCKESYSIHIPKKYDIRIKEGHKTTGSGRKYKKRVKNKKTRKKTKHTKKVSKYTRRNM